MTVRVPSTRTTVKSFFCCCWGELEKESFLSRNDWNVTFSLVLLLDYQDPVLKYHIESLISEYEQEWTVSAVYLQTNTKVQVETIFYQSRNQLKLFEKCDYPLFVLLKDFSKLRMSLSSMLLSQFHQLSLCDHTLSFSIPVANPSGSLSNAYSTSSRFHALKPSDHQLYIAYADEFGTFQYGHPWSGGLFRLGLRSQ